MNVYANMFTKGKFRAHLDQMQELCKMLARVCVYLSLSLYIYIYI